jgi:hypothetical protein
MAGKMQSYALALRESGSAFGDEGFALRKRLLEGCKSVPLVKGKALIAYTESVATSSALHAAVASSLTLQVSSAST